MFGSQLWVWGLIVLGAVAGVLLEQHLRRSREPRNCRPPAGSLDGAGDVYDIWFVSGGESLWNVPQLAKRAGFEHRLAIIQHTAIREETEQHLDEPLWMCILEFMRAQAEGSILSVARKAEHLGRHEIGIDVYLAEWTAQASDERDPAEALVIRGADGLTHLLLTEFWVSVGGPFPYHDTYTYSVFSKRDLSAALPAFLAERCAGRWNQATEVLLASEIV